MNSAQKTVNETNNIYIYDRGKAELTGIYDVLSFTDANITVTCKTGCISIEGKSLKIDSFDSATGELIVTGTLDGFFYFGKKEKSEKIEKGKKGGLSRLFG